MQNTFYCLTGFAAVAETWFTATGLAAAWFFEAEAGTHTGAHAAWHSFISFLDILVPGVHAAKASGENATSAFCVAGD
jgi:hypothetical protein